MAKGLISFLTKLRIVAWLAPLPGCHQCIVQVPNPDIKGREKILKVHSRKVPLGPDVDLRIIARGSFV